MVEIDANQKSERGTGIDRQGTRSWRADNPSDISEAIVSSALALVLIGLAIVGSIVLRESFAYLRDVFSM